MDFTIILLRKETLHKAKKEKKKKTQKENNADILKRISFLKFLFFWLRHGESDSYENVAVYFQWCERMEDNRQARKRNPKQENKKFLVLKKKRIHYKTKSGEWLLLSSDLKNQTNNGR